MFFLLLVLASTSSCLAKCTSVSFNGDHLPSQWMHAQLTPLPTDGTAVQPLGVTLALGISDRQSLNSTSLLLDDYFGDGASEEFLKQAILFTKPNIPSMLRFLHYEEASDTDVLFAFWHCAHMNDSWCSRWSSFASRFQDKSSIDPQTYFKWQSSDKDVGHFCEVPNANSAFTMKDFSRTLVGDGSHRELNMSIHIDISGVRVKQGECSLVLVEPLPVSIFADTFQLQRLSRRGRFKLAHVHGDTDVERPAVYSHQSIVELHVPVVGDETSFKALVSLPLHARYVPLSLESHYIVNVSSPAMLMQCGDSLHQVVWGSVPGNIDMVQWFIPAGNVGHSAFVPFVTYLVAGTGTLVLSVLSCWRRFNKLVI